MEKVYLPINVVNTFSVLIMFALGVTFTGFVYSAAKSYISNSAE
jgi:hypothetical protein